MRLDASGRVRMRSDAFGKFSTFLIRNVPKILFFASFERFLHSISLYFGMHLMAVPNTFHSPGGWPPDPPGKPLRGYADGRGRKIPRKMQTIKNATFGGN